MTTVLFGLGAPEKMLLASDDGKNFSPAAELPSSRAPENTVSFPAVTAKYFRVTFKRIAPASPLADASLRGDSNAAHRLRDRRTGAPCRSTGQSIRGESSIRHGSEPLHPVHSRGEPGRCDCEERRHRSDRENASGWDTRLDSSARQLGGSSLRLLTAWNHQSSGYGRGHRS